MISPNYLVYAVLAVPVAFTLRAGGAGLVFRKSARLNWRGVETGYLREIDAVGWV